MDKRVPIAVAAGNRGSIQAVLETTPQRLAAKRESTMILVGGVDNTGKVSTQTVYDTTGLIDVYAPGVNIEAPSVGNQISAQSGTSQAAAIVVCIASKFLPQLLTLFKSGLIAYYYGLPNLVGHDLSNMKSMVRDHAWVRNSLPPSEHFSRAPNVVYNLARGDPAHEWLCVLFDNRVGKREESGVCSLSSIAATSARQVYIVL